MFHFRKKALNVTCKEDLEKIRLSRFKVDKFVHLPVFKKTVVGCFVRIGIGTNPEKNIPMYRVAEITDVCETAKVYDVMKSRTNIGLRLKHGKMSKVFRAQFISNQSFTESEFLKWKQTCSTEHVDLPTFKHVSIIEH
jgi:RNA polymerase-associated protein RTF1